MKSRSHSLSQLKEKPFNLHLMDERKVNDYQRCSDEIQKSTKPTQSISGRSSFSIHPPISLESSVNLIPIAILDEDIIRLPQKKKQTKSFSSGDFSSSHPHCSVFNKEGSETKQVTNKWSSIDPINRQSKRRKSGVTQDTSTLTLQESRQRAIVKRRSQQEFNVSSKTKLTQLLKTTQLEQLSKLQSKHQQECELLDDIRNFGKQRSQIEKDYGQALQKLVQQYQKKDWPPFVEAEDTDKRPVLAVWKAVLDATDKIAQSRVSGSESYKNNIYEAAKNCRTQKDVQLKKCQELLNTLHNEVSETIKELTKAKKKYFEMEQIATMAKDKYQDVNNRLRKNQTSIFKSKSGLEKAFQKLQQKCDESSTNATIARNDYLLMLKAANSHQRRYYEVDMPEAMRMLDGNIFTKLQIYLGLLSQYELDASATTKEAYTASLQESTKISREYNARCFLRENPVFEWGPRYEFEACGEDNSGGKLIEEQPGNDNSLNREARKWTYRVERDTKQLMRLSKIREGLQTLLAKHAENRSSVATAQETEVRLGKCKQDMRKLETCRLQGEARLALLREANVNVDTWVESAKLQLAKESTTSVNSQSRLSMKSKVRTPTVENPRVNGESFIAGCDDAFTDDDSGDDFDEAFDDTHIEIERDNLSLPSSDQSRNYPVSCVVSYAYQATRPDELTIQVGAKIEVIEDGDLDQWVKARDSDGNMGYVPEFYLEFPTDLSSVTAHHQSYDKYSVSTSGECNNPSSSSSSSSSTSGTDLEVSNINSSVESVLHNSHGICLAKAVYEYEACTEEELSFPEGAIINILAKDDNGVDDGWWKGELNGKIGVFPGLVVEELNSQTNFVDSPEDSNPIEEPPDFQPPPPNERPPPLPSVEGSASTIPRNATWEGRPHAASTLLYSNVQSQLRPPEIRHARANSAPVSPEFAQIKTKPQRSAPAPPQRPSSFFRSHGLT